MLQRKILLSLAGSVLLNLPSVAQQTKTPAHKKETVPQVRPFYYKDHDSTFYQSYERYITARFFVSQKYSGFELQKAADISNLHYVPNTVLTLGVGATYQSVSVNLGYGFGFLNNDPPKGKTQSLDIQAHIYGRRWTYDVLGQFYKGYHLTPKGFASGNKDNYYTRPDMHVNLMGVTAYHLLNPSRFSTRAALLENEKQKKSAGSFLIGAEIYYGHLKADSAFVPNAIANNYDQRGVSRLDFIKIGPGIGYAYTWVIQNDFYIMGSLSASLNLDYSNEYIAGNKKDRFELNKGFIYRIAAGYDKNNWNANISLVGNQMTVTGASSSNKYLLSASNFRITFAKRIKPGRWLTRKLHPVDKVIENVRGIDPPKQ